jgi:putative flavoprotein involved in K+ transport
MATTDTIIIGAGQAGLAMSRCLTDHGLDHVVLERGRIAERWRSERWDSLRLLTPNWMTRLPGWSYDGADPDGFMTAGEVVAFFAGYARSSDAPIEEGTTVESLRFADDHFQVATNSETWRATNVVIATGWCDRPAIPAMAEHLSPDRQQVAPSAYRNPASLPDGGVLVVGASSTGVQLADELRAAGREVVLAVGRHSRLPRRYRGMDIYWWLERIGTLDRTITELPDPVHARHEPSLQLVGRDDGRSLDLITLRDAGVRITGRATGIDGHQVEFADDLAHTVAAADRRMARVLAEIDRHIDESGLADEVLVPEPMSSLRAEPAPHRLDLRAEGITNVVWATGFRRTYPWLHLPVLDRSGEICQRRGVTPIPGLYVLGQRFQHFRSSNFIDGVGRDAAFVADDVVRRTVPLTRH